MTQIFNQKPKTQLRKLLRRQPTKSETVLWKHLKDSQLGYKFRRQCGIGNVVVDFYCPQAKLAIELDGSTHEEEIVQEKDLKKQFYLQSLGLTVKRYTSEQVFKYLYETLQDIYDTCEYLTKK